MSVKSCNEEWTEQKLRQLFEKSSDVQIHMFHSLMLLYAEGLCDSSQLSKVIYPELNRIFQENKVESIVCEQLLGPLPIHRFEQETEEEIIKSVFQGDLVILCTTENVLFKLHINNRPERSPEESSIEISIKGPRDGFVEDIAINVALIRKRIRSTSLCCEPFLLGKRTQTKVRLLYIDDILAPAILQEVRTRLNNIDVDGLFSINQLEEALGDIKYPLFPLLDSTGRPDFAVNSLLAGRFVIIIDGNPLVLVGPATLGLILKSPEDIHFSFQYISFARLIRLFSFWFAILLPGLWVALTAFHQDQIPFRLMATMAVSRLGLPLPAQLEMFVLLLLLEIFREAGVRLPSSIGQTLTVIGALVIGDAAIRSGFISPSVVVVGAITAVMGVTLVNQTLSTIVSVLRFSIFLLSSILGMYGLILGLILLLFYMARLRSFGVAYFVPLSPLNIKELPWAYLRLPWSWLKYRPESLNPTDPDHKGDEEH
ncbi:spore germination protein [Paenibacillus sp. GCM10027626]|uniref:spore germination protein n=1 Tax=Paenibacillus sp. GCM10027626 TaxID=3273411 RepID=UPI00363AD1D3